MSNMNSINSPTTATGKGIVAAASKLAALEYQVNGTTLTTATVATGDLVMIQDASDSSNLKSVTAQSIANLGGGADLTSVTVDISSADILAMRATPVALIAAPGANKMICIVSVSFEFKHNTIAYTNNYNIQLIYGTTTGSPYALTIPGATTGLSTVVGTSKFTVVTNLLYINSVNSVNKPVYISNDIFSYATGDGTARITIFYKILDTLY